MKKLILAISVAALMFVTPTIAQAQDCILVKRPVATVNSFNDLHVDLAYRVYGGKPQNVSVRGIVITDRRLQFSGGYAFTHPVGWEQTGMDYELPLTWVDKKLIIKFIVRACGKEITRAITVETPHRVRPK